MDRVNVTIVIAMPERNYGGVRDTHCRGENLLTPLNRLGDVAPS